MFGGIYEKIKDEGKTHDNCPADLSSSNNSDAGTELSDMIKEDEEDDSHSLMITNGDENLNGREIPDNDKSSYFTGTATIISDNTENIDNLSSSIATPSSTTLSSTTPSTTTLCHQHHQQYLQYHQYHIIIKNNSTVNIFNIIRLYTQNYFGI